MLEIKGIFMNIYDFDGTIYNGDSGVDFIKYMFSKKPFLVTGHLIKFMGTAIKYKLKKITFKEMKEKLFSFVVKINNLEILLNDFANTHKDNIKYYYKEQRKNDDIIISASLDFYLLPLCKKIEINNVICTKYDVKNGKIVGENCKGEEKVRRFNEVYGQDIIIENSYGDSKHDIPILRRAQNGFMIKKEKVIKYEKNK